MMANTCAEGSISRAGDGQVFAGMPACNRGKDHAPQFISEQATGNLPRVGYQCFKYSIRRIVGGISADSSIRRPNRNARIVSFIAESGSIVAAHRTPSH